MKNLLILSSVFVFIIFSAFTTPKPNAKTINLKESFVSWKGYKVLGEHWGNVKFASGSLDFNASNVLTGGSFTVDMNSIDCQDLKAGQGKEKLEGHLKSDDFFGVAIYPNATLKFKKVISKGKPGEYKITADLTIKNTTKEVKFDAIINGNKATASLKIDRSDFDVKYGSGSFFDGLGDKTIYDEFDLNVNIIF
jgi:polyisoprenoid-binding protein YceI